MVGVLDLHAVVPCSNPVLTSGKDWFPVVPNSTLRRLANSQLVLSFPVGVLYHISVKFKLFLSDY